MKLQAILRTNTRNALKGNFRGLLPILVAFLLTGCSGAEDKELGEKIIGKWECYKLESGDKDLLAELPQNPIVEFRRNGIEGISGKKWKISNGNLLLGDETFEIRITPENKMYWVMRSNNGEPLQHEFRTITEEEFKMRPDLTGIVHLRNLGSGNIEFELEDDLKDEALNFFLRKPQTLACFADQKFAIVKPGYLLLPLWTKEGLKNRNLSKWKESRKGNGGDLELKRVNNKIIVNFLPWEGDSL